MVARVNQAADPSPGPVQSVGNREARVLVVTDDADDGELIIDALRAQGIEHIDGLVGLEACVGRYGGQAIDGAVRRPDLVVIDTKTPDARLTQCLERLKSGALSTVPVIVLSDLDDPERAEDCYGARAAAYLVKPTCPDRLRQTARSIASSWLPQGARDVRPLQE